MSLENLATAFFDGVKTRYARLERPISSISLFGGFVFDALTLKRIDMFWENVWVIVHLAVAGACIVLAHRAVRADLDAQVPERESVWVPSALQFCFGGLLSTFLVYYFRSGSLRSSWPFLLLLAAAFLANERLKKHFSRLDFQASFFFLSIFAFAIFIVPVVIHAMGTLVFLLSGAISLVLFWLFLRLLHRVAPRSFSRGRNVLAASIAGIFLAINVFYFLNVIPPIPLSLKDAAVEHSISRNAQGNFMVESEARSWLAFFRWASQFHCTASAPVYAYTAVFSPTSLHTKIVHEWQMWDAKRGWITMSRVELALNGGRDGGYRTYSMTRQIRPGAWRVNVETPGGALLGRLRFNVILQSEAPELQTELKN